MLAWLFAGGIGYWLWIRPEQLAAAERKAAQERAKQYYISHGMPDYDYKSEPVAKTWVDSVKEWLSGSPSVAHETPVPQSPPATAPSASTAPSAATSKAKPH